MVNEMKAFPNMTNQQGMDLRDYIAVRVLETLLKNSTTLGNDNDYSFEHAIWCGVNSEIDLLDGTNRKYTWARYYAEEAYVIADTMMKARETTKNEHEAPSAPAGGSTADPSSW